jgi:predicted nucleic acid-binding protein
MTITLRLDAEGERRFQPGHPMHRPATDAMTELRRQGDTLCLVPQNLYEFWVVCTRPTAQNGLGLTPAQAHAELTRLKSLFTILDDPAAILLQWEQLVTQNQVVGKSAHDARLVAAMIAHGIARILTFNTADFQRYQGIVALDPQQVVASLPPTP